jgi:hypothetical protein
MTAADRSRAGQCSIAKALGEAIAKSRKLHELFLQPRHKRKNRARYRAKRAAARAESVSNSKGA